jgi:hypothetical protein
MDIEGRILNPRKNHRGARRDAECAPGLRVACRRGTLVGRNPRWAASATAGVGGSASVTQPDSCRFAFLHI